MYNTDPYELPVFLLRMKRNFILFYNGIILSFDNGKKKIYTVFF